MKRVRGRLAPAEMFPAGVEGITVRRATLRDGTGMRVAESGARDAPAVVLLHGWGASIYMWRAWFAPLTSAGWRVVAVDLPGHGLSDVPAGAGAGSLDTLEAQLGGWLEDESLTGAHVVAQSMGGTIALEMSLRRPASVGRLVLVNPALFGVIPQLRIARHLNRLAIDRMLPRLQPRWVVARAHRLVYADPSRITRRDIDEYWAPSQRPEHVVAMRRLLREFSWDRPPVDELCARLRTRRERTMIVLGARDRLVRGAGPYVAAACAAGATLDLFTVENGGHAVNEELPEVVIPKVLEFLGAS